MGFGVPLTLVGDRPLTGGRAWRHAGA